jgi:hypothetical protein
MEIGESIKYPTTDNDWIKKVVIGGILGMIPIVNFIVQGYYLKILKGSIENKSGMPEWEDWGNLFIKGLIVFIISIIYMLIPIIVISISVGGAILAAVSGGTDEAIVAAIGAAAGGLLIAFILMLISLLLLPMALAIYAKEESFGSAFRFGEIINRIFSNLGSYILVYLVIIVLGIIVGIITGILNIIPLLGMVIAIFANFYIVAVAAKMFGEVYTNSKA